MFITRVCKGGVDGTRKRLKNDVFSQKSPKYPTTLTPTPTALTPTIPQMPEVENIFGISMKCLLNQK